MLSKTRATVAVASVAMMLLAAGTTSSTAEVSHQQIQGSGSSWATNAMNVWIAGVTSSGLKVVFTSTGSAIGRKDFGNGTTDYAVSDIGYQHKDPLTGDYDEPCKIGDASSCRDYAYLPIVAGGTAFPYHIEKQGKLVRNLRLSTLTLAKIFTGKITNWGDPAITKDNNGNKMPSIPIIPVNHAEGSGSTAQFTTFLSKQYPDLWQPFAGGSGFTEYYPTKPNMIKQTGSDGVINFVTGDAGNGAIGYDEYSYALAKNYPVAKIENKAGYYTLPNQYNVAVALRHADINKDKSSPDYLLQKLDNVFVAPEVQAYPLSSYSYMIIPTGANDPRMKGATAKRQTLADFIYYSVCQGQKQMGPIGYSPLPLNLVQASFEQTAKLKAVDPGVVLDNRNVTTCNNPTFVPGDLSRNHLAEIAPKPPTCDRDGQGPCIDGTDRALQPSGSSGNSGASDGTGNSAAGNPNGSNTGNPGGNSSGSSGSNTSGKNPNVKQATGVALNPEDPNYTSDSGSAGGGDAVSASTDIPAYRQVGLTRVLAPLAAVELLLILLAPPALSWYLRRRRGKA